VPGPAPKDPKIRQRRNKVSTSATLTRTTPRRQRAARLPKNRRWHELTRAWWADVWHSPMAENILRADEHALLRLAVLIDMFWQEPTKEIAAEIRLEQQAFGLTPLDRRRLQWTVEEEDVPRRARRAVVDDDEADDPRTILRMVAHG
jgi:hypothetical protein